MSSDEEITKRLDRLYTRVEETQEQLSEQRAAIDHQRERMEERDEEESPPQTTLETH